jgi:hypothetical protein
VFGVVSRIPEVTTKGEAHWNLKAYNGRVVCAWLAHAAVQHALQSPVPENLVLASCMPCPQIISDLDLMIYFMLDSTSGF